MEIMSDRTLHESRSHAADEQRYYTVHLVPENAQPPRALIVSVVSPAGQLDSEDWQNVRAIVGDWTNENRVALDDAAIVIRLVDEPEALETSGV